MNYGLYLAAGGTMTNMHRLEVASNNLANLKTTGFKPDLAVSQQRMPARLADPTLAAPPRDLLEQLGGGQWLGPTRINLAQGPLEQTGKPLDAAIEGAGFFVVAGHDQSNVMLTRDGRFSMNEQSELVMTSTGRHVLDVNGMSIRLHPDAETTIIDGDGMVIQDDSPVAQIRLVAPPAHALTKQGENLFALRDAGDLPDAQAPGRIVQHYIEDSAVNPVLVLNDLIDASRAIEQNAQMMKYMDNALGQTINTFGRVA